MKNILLRFFAIPLWIALFSKIPVQCSAILPTYKAREVVINKVLTKHPPFKNRLAQLKY